MKAPYTWSAQHVSHGAAKNHIRTNVYKSHPVDVKFDRFVFRQHTSLSDKKCGVGKFHNVTGLYHCRNISYQKMVSGMY